jgi:hypothetical protein
VGSISHEVTSPDSFKTFLHVVQTGSGAQSESFIMGTVCSLPENKAAGA